MARDFVTIGCFNHAIRAFDAYAERFLRRENFHAKPLRLHHGAARQIATAKPHRKSQIIFDARTHAGLPARSFAFDHHRVQTFGGAVNGGGQTRGPSTDNCQIIKIRLRASL